MIKQPDKSKVCGQCCLATILGITLEEAVKLVGHSRGTYTKELTKHFEASPLKRGKPDAVNGLCKVHFKTAKNTHWVIYIGGLVYEPAYGGMIPFNEWAEFDGARITSHVEILQPIKTKLTF